MLWGKQYLPHCRLSQTVVAYTTGGALESMNCIFIIEHPRLPLHVYVLGKTGDERGEMGGGLERVNLVQSAKISNNYSNESREK